MSIYMINVATQIIIQAIAACGLNIIVGHAGQISLGHAAFVGIGAYSNAMLTTAGGLTFWQALPISLLIVGLIGLLCGLPSLRVKEDFLAITTIGINFIVVAIFQYTPALGGALGIGGIPNVSFFDFELKARAFFWFCLLCLLAVLAISWFFTKSWLGLSCFAIREEETAASSMGVSPVRAKLSDGGPFWHLIRSLHEIHQCRFIHIPILCNIAFDNSGRRIGNVLGTCSRGCRTGHPSRGIQASG